MLPISLKIQGFYSYENEVTIDFTRLMRGGIFGIFGKVGSGKSSILEAMMFALYGEVARMDSKGRSYNIMNLRSAKMMIDFIFKTEKDTYRIIVTATRNKRHFDSVNTPEFRHSILQEDGTWLPTDTFDAAKILGLEAKNFRQTVIIPQNEFQNFLHLGNTDRTRMIKDIFPHLEKFELEENVRILETENNNALLILKEKLNEIGEVSDAGIKEKRQLLKKIKSDLTATKKELASGQKNEATQKRLKEKMEAMALVEKEILKLDRKDADMQALRRKIADYEYYLTDIKTLYEQFQLKTDEQIAQQKDVLAQTKQLTLLEKQTLEIKTAQAIFQNDYERKDEILKEVEDYKLLAKIKKSEQELADLKTELEKTSAQIKQFVEQKQILAQQKAPFVLEHEALSANPPDFSELNAIADWFNEFNVLNKDLETLSKQKAELEARFTGVDDRKKNIIINIFPRLGIDADISTKLSACVLLIKDRLKNAIAYAETLQKNITVLYGNEKLESLSAELSDGSPCPLCGAVHHPNKMNVGVLRQHLKQAETEAVQHKKTIDTLHQFEREMATMFENGKELQMQIKNISDSYQLTVDRYRLHEKKFIFQNFFQQNNLEINSENNFSKNNFQEFILIRDEANRFNEKISKLKKEIETIDIKMYAINSEEENLRKQIIELEKQLAVKENTISNLQFQVGTVREVSLLGIEDLKSLAENLEKHIRLVIKKYISSEKELQTLKSETDKLQGIVSEKNNALTQIVLFLEKIKNSLDEKIIQSPFGDLGILKIFLSKAFDITQARKQIAEFDKNKLTLQNRLAELIIETKGEKFDADAYTEILTQIETLMLEIETLTGQNAVLEVEINDWLQKLERRISTEKDVQNREYRATNLATMKSLFARSGFVNYASTVYLQNLCLTANKRFMPLTRHHLRLEVTDDNNFIIRDMMNNGQTRSVKTLSGGQTFQAALSLALALAENIQAITNTHHNFFFLDEGFGSLDRESLQIVFETLKQLQKENRIVGIISHVEEMQQEIDDYLLVTLDEETGSVIN